MTVTLKATALSPRGIRNLIAVGELELHLRDAGPVKEVEITSTASGGLRILVDNAIIKELSNG